ncbi:MAG: protein TolR [Sphingomonadales bacterium]|nr:protein TolR [Sphingomonadales bacterium]PIX67724.1 MAG: protein TolR [Sphingomonadales bacterium CG_4_10_14_3_um_filter_58_15]NCO49521.1 protein TolR [Sphingomonadales bacterium]NCP01114.1 protein TolR [Sphingomonadales bacterium]NCP25498.1 protein TolR [Sphingomonadales bacterium]
MGMNMGSRIGRRGGSRGRAPMAEINVTPFVDVMLVLLIIFMVTAPLLVTGVPVDLPESRANALEQEQEPVQISIDNEGRVFIEDEEVSRGALATRLREIAADQNPEDPRQIMLRGDKTLDYGLIMGVMGELNRAGLNRVSLVTTGSSETP